MILGIRIVMVLLAFLIPTVTTLSWTGSAKDRVEEAYSENARPAEGAVAIAAAADEEHCTADLKKILRRVLYSCGLLGAAEAGAVRGCQPLEAKNVATMSGDDFNALFQPMKDRGGIVQFQLGDGELDEVDTKLVDKIFSDQKGASYFFVVARASPDGSTERNRELSKERAEAIMTHLRSKFNDPDLDKEVGLLWLGEEFAQLNADFCDWQRSDAGDCNSENLNRSAFITWIDCRL